MYAKAYSLKPVQSTDETAASETLLHGDEPYRCKLHTHTGFPQG